MGADDYVTKPFSVKILLQRIKALQRRSEVSADESTVELIEHKQVKVDMVRHKAFVLDQELDLTPPNFACSNACYAAPGAPFHASI